VRDAENTPLERSGSMSWDLDAGIYVLEKGRLSWKDSDYSGVTEDLSLNRDWM
jgi:hypothetical protein